MTHGQFSDTVGPLRKVAVFRIFILLSNDFKECYLSELISARKHDHLQ